MHLNERCDDLVIAGRVCAFGCHQHECASSSPQKVVGRNQGHVLCTVTTEQSSVMLW